MNRLLLLLPALLLGCDLLSDEFTVDPNQASAVPAEQVFTGALLGHAAFHEGHGQRVAGLWSGAFRGEASGYAGIFSYQISATSLDVTWSNLYYGCIGQAPLVLDAAANSRNALLWGAMATAVAHGVGTAAALWGDVPFSQAAQGTENLNPAFDPQRQVLDSAVALLEAAADSLATGRGDLGGAADIYFAGDYQNWLAANTTLQARFHYFLGNHTEALAAVEARADQANGSTMAVPHEDATGQRNFANEFLTGSRKGDMSAEDVRITRWLEVGQPDYRGHAKTDEAARFAFRYQTVDGVLEPNSSAAGVYGPDADFALVHSQEHLLLGAELELLADDADAALDYLNQHRAYLRTLFPAGTYDELVLTDFDPAGVEGQVGLSAEQALMREIRQEQQVFHWGTYTGFLLLLAQQDAAAYPSWAVPQNTGAGAAQRFLLPQSELQGNANAPAQTSDDVFVPTELFPAP